MSVLLFMVCVHVYLWCMCMYGCECKYVVYVRVRVFVGSWLCVCVWCMCGACMFMCVVCVYVLMYVCSMCVCACLCGGMCVGVCVCVTLLAETPEDFLPVSQGNDCWPCFCFVCWVLRLQVYKNHILLSIAFQKVIGHKLFLHPTCCGKYYLWISYHHINYRGMK